jgi:hypothetical protein
VPIAAVEALHAGALGTQAEVLHAGGLPSLACSRRETLFAALGSHGELRIRHQSLALPPQGFLAFRIGAEHFPPPVLPIGGVIFPIIRRKS